MKQSVYVVTGFDLGWDCVVGVFTGISKENLYEQFPEGQYYIAEHQVETSLINYE